MVKAGKPGPIVNIGFIYGMVSLVQDIYAYKEELTGVPSVKQVAYPAAKSGIYSLTRYFAAYRGKKQIRVNTLSLSGVWRETQDEYFQSNYCSRIPIGCMAREDEYNGAKDRLDRRMGGIIAPHQNVQVLAQPYARPHPCRQALSLVLRTRRVLQAAACHTYRCTVQPAH